MAFPAAVVAGASFVGKAGKAVGKLFSSARFQTRSQRDRERFRQIDHLFEQARGGDAAARQRICNPTWATAKANDYARGRCAELAAVDAGAPIAPTAQPPTPESPFEQATEPLRQALATSASQVREAAASTVERVGVGAGAAGARGIRGAAGPLDQLIAFVQRPAGVLAVGGVVLVVALAGSFLLGRR